MPIAVARERGGRLEEALATLLPVEPYLAYANFAPIAPRAVDLHRRWWLAAGEEGALVARGDGGEPLATVCVARRDFESAHFGMPVARVAAPVAVVAEDVRLPALRALYAGAWQMIGDAGYRHVSAVCSARDRTACWALQER